jgi:hypothetical protein
VNGRVHHVFGWPSDTGACRFYRTQLPLDALSAAGHTTRIAEGSTVGGRAVITLPDEIRDNPEWLVVLQRSHNPAARRTMFDFCARGRPWIFDVDDNLWAVEHDNPAAAAFNRPDTQDTLTWMVQNASAVTVSTEPLAEVVRAMTEVPVHVLHNALPAASIDTSDVTDREPCVFWRGSATHDRDVDIMRYALKRVERAGVRIVLAGQDYRKRLGLSEAVMLDDVLYADPVWRKLIKANRWDRVIGNGNTYRRAVHLPTGVYIDAVQQVVKPTVVVAPLRSSVFNDSKSAIAAIEGHSTGAYVIASAMPAYSDYLDGYGNLVKWNEHDWWRAVSDALDMDAADRTRWAEIGRARLASTSIETITGRYEAVYDTVSADTITT